MLTQAMLTFLTVGRKASRSASTIIIVNVSKMPHSRRIGFIVFSSFQLLKVRRDNAQVHLTDVALYSTCSHFQLIPAGCRYQNHPLWRRTQQKLTPFYLYLLLHFFTLNQARKNIKTSVLKFFVKWLQSENEALFEQIQYYIHFFHP